MIWGYPLFTWLVVPKDLVYDQHLGGLVTFKHFTLLYQLVLSNIYPATAVWLSSLLSPTETHFIGRIFFTFAGWPNIPKLNPPNTSQNIEKNHILGVLVLPHSISKHHHIVSQGMWVNLGTDEAHLYMPTFQNFVSGFQGTWFRILNELDCCQRNIWFYFIGVHTSARMQVMSSHMRFLQLLIHMFSPFVGANGVAVKILPKFHWGHE